jgi:hypothetical protein
MYILPVQLGCEIYDQDSFLPYFAKGHMLTAAAKIRSNRCRLQCTILGTSVRTHE